ncbi:unnamed protein product [Zymoseptoria tritici ST99CH_1A5]|uniref:PH domain-containing protein n=4 Tax=Zymoseptoria tritici TaxID=1047171 RepID=A0A1X7S4L3_ZYMT9|nr:unnamed protein product [Zymoseptoria tritici ST99CH_3D7]SMR59049.1 unnamed protein product [Zymoseptoria tritici ST99CH_1E4]SMY28258.1 unnamed protein product [Zymoseptoria tritici ST99CH_1A5]
MSHPYTARRLEHATPDHLHETTRRVFIGPLPEGWLKSHRKHWFRQYVGRGGERVPTFSAAHPIGANYDGPVANISIVASTVEPRTDPELRMSTQSADAGALSSETALSTRSLLHSQHVSSAGPSSLRTTHEAVDNNGDAQETEESTSLGQDTQITARSQQTSVAQERSTTSRLDRVADKIPVPKVRFTQASRLQLRARASRLAARGTFRTNKAKDGEMLKVDKMLIRIDITQQFLREDYDEKLSQGVETRSVDKWREFMVVCRKHSEEDAEAVLQFYQTRVITVSEGENVKKKPKVQILLSQKRSHINLYSALDKTLCLWSTKDGRTTIYYLRAQSTATALDWYTFLRGVLGYQRADTLQVNIPDLSVNLRLDDPFRVSEKSQTLADAADGNDEALAKALTDEKGAAGAIVARCIEMLKHNPEWTDVLTSWAKNDRIGLAWKRYDRLEWIYGSVEQQMYGSIAMERTHDLELRPKDHYPTYTKVRNSPRLEEPSPIEGFLIRLTSQTGKEQRLGKMLFKRLYFATQNQYLIFVRPAAAHPPPPPRMPTTQEDGAVPTAKQFAEQVPLAYDIEPYPLRDGRIAWLDAVGDKSRAAEEDYDSAAAAEAERNTNILLACDGFIDLCDVQTVRAFAKGATPIDDALTTGGDNVDFHAPVPDSRREDGNTTDIDHDRVIELVLKNGLVIRLQAYNKDARTEWMTRLQQLTEYWSQRITADMSLYRTTRDQNLRELGIDERAEAVVGQFAYKWEVGKSYASPTLYNMCGISDCRTIHMSGALFRKPRKHTTFTRCHVILSHGHLLIFQDTLRKRTGKKLVHIHHERIASMSLQGCYLYSGLLTENDLLYQNQTFDSNAPGHHSLPRIYLEDNWTSTDEDAMTTFVIWHPKSTSWFKSSHTVDDVKAQQQESSSKSEGGAVKTKLTRVSQLGATGRSVVFKARSRAERDHWVLAIQVEIERLTEQNAELRLVDEEGK